MRKVSSLMLSVVLAFSLFAPLISVSALEYSGDYGYSVLDGTATIEEYDGSGGVIEIPDTLGGYPVTGIEEAAFIAVRV